MFRPFQKNYILYYLALIFLAYPIGGVIWFGYPLWTLALTSLFTISYLALIHINNQFHKTIFCLWFNSLAYVVYMSCFYDGAFMWFFFFHSNLLIWRFRDKIKSYRAISFLLALGSVVIYGQILSTDIISRLMVTVVPIFILFMSYSQYNIRKEDDMKSEIYKQNETINLLAAENERNRIGRDLHDTLGHTFAMMTLKTELALKQLDKENLVAVQKELEELNQISRKSMKDVRQLINNLKYRTVGEELDNIRDMFSLSDIELQVQNTVNTDHLSPVIQSSINMILRELTTNIIKHAKAKHCQICLQMAEAITIEVTDDGQGFSNMTGDELHSIKERLQLVKGKVEILSSANPTKIRVSLEEGELS